MQTIQASEAKTHFLRILDEVERGSTIIVTRRGKPVARISPEPEIDREKVRRAMDAMRSLRLAEPPLTIEEILSARDEGRS